MGYNCLIRILSHNWAAILADFFHNLSHNWVILTDLVRILSHNWVILTELLHSHSHNWVIVADLVHSFDRNYNCYSVVMASLKSLSVSLNLAVVTDNLVPVLMDTFDSLVAAALEFAFIMQMAKPWHSILEGPSLPFLGNRNP